MQLRNQLLSALKELKNDFGVLAIKAELEAEGARKDELIMLREMVDAVDLGFIVKIGGCEAIHDMDLCKLLGVTGVMAPMIETPFAMDKFRLAFERVYKNQDADRVEKIINAETITCLNHFDAILEHGAGFLTGVTVGRSDLSASMGIPRAEIESDIVFSATEQLTMKSAEAGLTTNFGGNIGIESVPFIRRLGSNIDRFETRKVVIRQGGDEAFLKKAIAHSLKFELLYLNFKSAYYRSMANEDSTRIERLKYQIARGMEE